MFRPTHPTAAFRPWARAAAAAALLVAASLPWAPSIARAEGGAEHPQGAAQATSSNAETVEVRIATLRTALKITPDQDAKWNAVAGVMRDNAASMEKLRAEKRAQVPGDMTALDDLLTYEAFAQAHVNGLKALTAAFTALYQSMPEDQKKVADSVFRDFGREGADSHHTAR